MIVLEDADIRAAAKWGVWGAAVYNTGQSCVAVERIYVVEDVYEEFLAAVLDEVKQIRMGYSEQIYNHYHMGPLTFDRQLGIIEDHLRDALAKGAKILTGGKRDGMFFEPTVLVDVDHTMKVMLEETFGPLIPIMKVSDETHAIQLANHSEQGLDAYIWTRDLKRAKRVARQMDVGVVNINDVLAHYPVSLLPFGGAKMSGNARTHGKDEVIQFTQLRSYAVGHAPSRFDVATVLRNPNHYRLGAALLRFAFGVTPRQRLQPVGDFMREEVTPARVARTSLATAALATLAVVAMNLVRGRKA
jgi:acyl-CoA reductase-like NAD-dependent aldehyde dehydrogenase